MRYSLASIAVFNTDIDNSGVHLFNCMVSIMIFTSSSENTVLVFSPIFIDEPSQKALPYLFSHFYLQKE